MLDLGTGQVADLAVPLDRDELIDYGPRLSDNGAPGWGRRYWSGGRPRIRHVPSRPRTGTPTLVHNWQFGKRS